MKTLIIGTRLISDAELSQYKICRKTGLRLNKVQLEAAAAKAASRSAIALIKMLNSVKQPDNIGSTTAP